MYLPSLASGWSISGSRLAKAATASIHRLPGNASNQKKSANAIWVEKSILSLQPLQLLVRVHFREHALRHEFHPVEHLVFLHPPLHLDDFAEQALPRPFKSGGIVLVRKHCCLLLLQQLLCLLPEAYSPDGLGAVIHHHAH